MNELFKCDELLSATTTLEGFIEVTALDELDKVVGGFLNPDEIFIELDDNLSWPSLR